MNANVQWAHAWVVERRRERWAQLQRNGLADKTRMRSDAYMADVKRLQSALSDVVLTAPMICALGAGDVCEFGRLVSVEMAHEIARDAQDDTLSEEEDV